MPQSQLSIADTEKITGIRRDLLRMWERRYGFPCPLRDEEGDRLYPSAQVEKLRLIRILQGYAHRPHKLMPLSTEALSLLLSEEMSQFPSRLSDEEHEEIAPLLICLKQNNLFELELLLQQELARLGLRHFVEEWVRIANIAVGEAWQRGTIGVFVEHVYSENIRRTLNQAVSNLPRPSSNPKFLLATLTDEKHTIGLMMIECLMRLQGFNTIFLGAELSLNEIHAAALQYDVQVVLLSFGSGWQTEKATENLHALRFLLPSSINMWVGGQGTRGVQQDITGVSVIKSFKALNSALNNLCFLMI